MKARGGEREKQMGQRHAGREGGRARVVGEREESDFAALLADLVQSLWCSD